MVYTKTIIHLRVGEKSVLNKKHYLEALGNKLIQILVFIPQSVKMMSVV